jgi:hypothetical protein
LKRWLATKSNPDKPTQQFDSGESLKSQNETCLFWSSLVFCVLERNEQKLR